MSFLNGLASAGAGLAQVGAEMQKSDASMALQNNLGQIQGGLQQQKADLELTAARQADALATARESAGRVQAAGIASTVADKEMAFKASEAEKMRNADTPEIKLLRVLGALPPSGASSSGATTSAPAPASSTTDTTSSLNPSATSVTPDAGTTPPAATAAPVDITQNNLVAKTLGLPMAGSDAAIRSAIAKDVAADPKFKYAPLGQQAAEVENRLAVAKGTMTDPASREVLAKAIAGYQKAPLDNMALMKGGGPETMSRVMEINPDYQEARYPEVAKAMAAFGAGTQGDKVRFLNTGVQHLDVFDQAAQALKNNDPKMLNSLTNYFRDQFGVSAPNTFDGLKQIVGTEIEKAIAGGIGASSDRDRLMKALSSANSPEQLQDMTNGFRDLMAGQLRGLKTQYEDATGFKTGPFAFENKLDPATLKAIGPRSDGSAPSAPTKSAAPAGRPPLADILRPPAPSLPSAPY